MKVEVIHEKEIYFQDMKRTVFDEYLNNVQAKIKEISRQIGDLENRTCKKIQRMGREVSILRFLYFQMFADDLELHFLLKSSISEQIRLFKRASRNAVSRIRELRELSQSMQLYIDRLY